MRSLRPPGLEALFGATIVLFGFRLGARPIGDNSTFVHLRTGIDIVAGGGIPRSDPYSSTAAGEPWIVQSWLASVLYGATERLAGLEALVLLQAVLMGVLAALVVLLARAGTPLRTAAAGTVAVGIGAAYWVPRPLLFGLICLALLVLAVERRWPWWVLVPVMWVWVNTHGTFLFAAAWLGLVAAGAWIDGRRFPRHLVPYAGGLLAGLAAAVVNPLGPRLLAFPFTSLEHRDQLRTLTEWRTPDFGRADGLFALVFIALAVVIVARTRHRWADVIPFVVFLALGLLALRNVAVFGVAAAPILGRALASSPRPAPSPAGADPPRLNLAFAGVLAAAFLLFAAGAWTGPALALDDYPLDAVAWLDDEGLAGPRSTARIAHDEVVGCYLILRYGRDAGVFVDDRLDMYPAEVSRDLDTLIGGGAAALDVLDRREVDAVLWRRGGRLIGTLLLTGTWVESYADDDWVVLSRVPRRQT